MQQLSFKVQALDDLRAMYRVIWDRRDVSRIVPVDHGNAWSLYFHDPEMNRIEIYLDTPWHIAQPHREELDLSLSDAKILALTEQRARRDAGFQPMAQYRAALAERIAATRQLAAGPDAVKTP
jgi:catechol-2,3-dioxygenase